MTIRASGILVLWCYLMTSVGVVYAEMTTERKLESELSHAVSAVLHASPEVATTLQPLLDLAPNLHLARMIEGDMYRVRAHGEVLWAQSDKLNKRRIAGLRNEAMQRLFFRSPLPEYLPAEVLRLSLKHRYILLLDAERARLFLFENLESEPHLLASYYASVGADGMGKQRRGDKKTPLGVYRVTGWHEDKALAELYGAGAYPLNYPNWWDRLNQRDGSGIWVHGTPRDMHGRPPQDSRGCVVINNDIISALRDLTEQPTLVVLTHRSHWLPRAEWHLLREAVSRRITQWHDDWESLNTDDYLAHYSKNYQDQHQNYATMTQHTRRVAKKKTFVSVEIDNMDLFLYPSGEEPLMLAVFDQDYQSNNYNLNYRKQQMWREEGGELFIVSEGKWE